MIATLFFFLACQPEPAPPTPSVGAEIGQADPLVQSQESPTTSDPGANDAALMAAFTEEIEANPSSSKAWFNRGHHHISLQRWVQAEADLTQSVSLPDPPPLAHKDLAGAQLSQRNFHDALANIDHYLTLQPDDAEGYHMRGFCRKSTGDMPGAVEDAKRACEMGIEKDCRIVTWLENQIANEAQTDETETP